MIKISGGSDDIVMIESDSAADEFYPRDDEKPFYVAISNGMLVRVTYDGRWNIGVESNPNDVAFDHRKATNDEDDYSGVLLISSSYEWVIGGQDRF